MVVVSGHLPPGHPESLVDWTALGRLRGTVCVLMGLANAAAIAEVLMAHGRDPMTPVAFVKDGTLPSQQVVRTTLSKAADITMTTPAVIVIGNVVGVLDGTG